MLGYISRGFVAIVMKRPELPWPLKGLPALNDLGAERRGSGAEPSLPPQRRNYRTSMPLAGLFTLLSVRPVVLYFFSFSFFFFNI